jgi:hypothetical protein
MRIRKPSGHHANPLPGSSGNYRNGKVCPRCKKFGTYAPNSIVCDRCLGALPLLFTVAVASSVTAGALVVSISIAVRGDHR